MILDLKEIRELAKRFSPEQIEGCIEQQIETGSNVCIRNESEERMINELAKAQFIRERIEEGLSLGDALRELARHMRIMQERMK
jgi:chaperonin GroEL (HSP60 family)